MSSGGGSKPSEQKQFTRLAREAAEGKLPDCIGVAGYAPELELLDSILVEALNAMSVRGWAIEHKTLPLFVSAMRSDREDAEIRRLVLLAIQAFQWYATQFRRRGSDRGFSAMSQIACAIMRERLGHKANAEEAFLMKASEIFAGIYRETQVVTWEYVDLMVKGVTRLAAKGPLSPRLIEQIRALRRTYLAIPHQTKAVRKTLDRLRELAGDAAAWPITADQAWSAAALTDFEAMGAAEREAWRQLLSCALECNPTKPNRKLMETAGEVLKKLTPDAFEAPLDRWISTVTAGNIPAELSNTHLDAICGLMWIAACRSSPTACRIIADVAEAAWRKATADNYAAGVIGGGAVRSLASINSPDALAQLSRLELRIRRPKAKKLLRKLMPEVIERSGLSRQDLEETLVPDFGLQNGRAKLPLGDWHAEIAVVDGSKPTVHWIKPDGARARSVSPAIKCEHADAFESVQRTIKDLEAMLPAQRTRVELLMRSTTTWPYEQFRQRYLDHGLLSTFARRLIWTVDRTPVLFLDPNQVLDVSGAPLSAIDPRTSVGVWHPIDHTADEIVAWRQRLESLQISQPFKQAHREIYLLTDAELNTDTYSNRFAAHIVKTPTLLAISQTRGWKAGLFGGASSPSIDLPQWRLRAEFWAQPAGDQYSDFGAPLYLSTDQIRFYAADLETARACNNYGELTDPLRLAFVPPRIFSEVLRDCDLFVGLASVGADPTWQDAGGPREAQFRDYWSSFSFGDLSASARTRRDVLSRLVPRLKIASQCALTDKFLVVKGSLRTYKIHLGSGNILMAPNDQYLCIVPDRKPMAPSSGEGPVFLPFEGDSTLSIIISKAFMLADDTSIKDETILRQIKK